MSSDGIRESFPDVADAVALRKPRRLPVFLFGVNPYSASFCGVRFSDCMLNNDLYADCAIRLARHFQPDGLMNVNAALASSALRGRRLVERDGARYLVDEKTGEDVMRIPDDGNPQSLIGGQITAMKGTQRFEDAEKLAADAPERLDLADLANAPTEADDVYAANLRRVNEALGGRVLLSTGVCNPCNPLASSFGFEALCLAMLERPTLVRKLANLYTIRSLRPLRARILAGGRLVYTGSSWASLLGRSQYAEFFHEPQTFIHQAVRAWGAIPTLHATGAQMHFMDLNVASKPDIILVDHVNSIAEVKARFGDKVCLTGGLDPSGVLYRGTPADVRREVTALLEKVAHNGGYILCTSDCVVLDTPRENVEALFAVARQFT
ncbi:MAG: hypothetical protein FJ279_21185 [Planctomycetes bacterium]|nr:hypothetical protein [Planctomycetota bacterium]